MLHLLFGCTIALAQTSPPLKPGDVDTVDHIVAALYQSISGSPTQERDWDRMRSLFAANAPMVAVYTAGNGDIRLYDTTLDKYIQSSTPYFKKEGFFEHETHRRTNNYRHLYQLWSSYVSQHALGEKPFDSGVNSIVLYNDGHRFWIKSIIWEGTDKPGA